jgi:hypothetical protein
MHSSTGQIWAIACALSTLAIPRAEARPIRVPQDQPTIQAAVDAADPGDRVVVGAGRFCGATITKQIHLVSVHHATIVGCPQPAVGPLRVGFFLPDGRASRTTIRGFRFDGAGISNADLTPIAAGILARSVDGVTVTHNHFIGTIQAVTNTDGSEWTVFFNRVEHLTALTCDGLCSGGDGIVFQQRLHLESRPHDNVAAFNRIEGRIPDGLDQFSFAGIFVLGQDGGVVFANDLAIPDNPNAAGAGDGITVSDHCCANVAVSTSINSRILFNDGRRSEIAVNVEPDVHGGQGNLQGAIIFGNRGRIVGVPDSAVRRWLWAAESEASLETVSLPPRAPPPAVTW